jgi:2,3-bisphosphoglycerate-dependent phosphoglycerate mutase
MDPSKLLQDGRYREAIEAYTRRLRREQSASNYAYRAEAYFNLKYYDTALADFHAANAAAIYTSDHYLERIGVVNWLAGRYNTAAGTWFDLVLTTERGKIQYTDGAGGVEPGCLLWFAAASLGVGVGIEVGETAREVGTSSFLHAFFSSVSRNLEPAGWGSRFPVLMNHLYQGRMPPELVESAIAEVSQVRKEFSGLPPRAVVWDIDDLTKQPPWGEEFAAAITSLANYFVTSNGFDLFEVIIESLQEAKKLKLAVSICPY